jgi:hypothetical protein
MILQVTPEALPKFHMWTQLMANFIPIRPQTFTILQVTPDALPKFHMWTQLMTSLVPIRPQTSTILQEHRRQHCRNSTDAKSKNYVFEDLFSRLRRRIPK